MDCIHVSSPNNEVLASGQVPVISSIEGRKYARARDTLFLQPASMLAQICVNSDDKPFVCMHVGLDAAAVHKPSDLRGIQYISLALKAQICSGCQRTSQSLSALLQKNCVAVQQPQQVHCTQGLQVGQNT